jgi:hypothetical protein
MKKIFSIFTIVVALTLTACQGDQGPSGEDGINILGSVFETTIDFNPNNNYSALITIPLDIQVFESDVILVYLLEDVVPDGQGGSFDVWSQLPQTFFPSQGTLVYNFDHTFVDVRLFLGSNFNLDTLGSEFTNDQTFRIAILPAEFADTTMGMDILLETINISEINVINLN